MARGSWPLLGAAALGFLLAFAWQRQRSEFLAIEGDATLAPLARRYGLDVPDVFALRTLVGRDVSPAAWEMAVAQFAAERLRFGDGLAAVALVGDRAAAEAALAASADAAVAWQRFRSEPAAVPGLQFLALRARFAPRQAARD